MHTYNLPYREAHNRGMPCEHEYCVTITPDDASLRIATAFSAVLFCYKSTLFYGDYL